MKKNIIGAVLSAVAGLIAGLLLLFILAAVFIRFDDPDGGAKILSLVSLFFGALVCGRTSKKLCDSILSGVYSGLAYSSIIAFVSFFGKSSLGFIEKIGICFSLILISFFFSALSGKKKKGRSPSGMMKSLYKKV